MSKVLYKTAINIVPRPYKYKNITAANASIKCQDDTYYSCRIVTMNVNDEDIYYIDVIEKHTGNFAGYLGESYA